VHSDIALNLAALCHRLRFCLRFRPAGPFGPLGYNQPKVLELCLCFLLALCFFQRMIICFTFRVTLSIRGSLNVNGERKGARDAIVTVPLSCFSPYYDLSALNVCFMYVLIRV